MAQILPKQKFKTYFYLLVLAICLGSVPLLPFVRLKSQAVLAQMNASPQREEALELVNLGSQQYQNRQFQEAIQSLEAALQIFHAIDDRQNEVATLGNLGLVYRSLGQAEQAIARFEQALTVAYEINDLSGEISALSNLGRTYRSLGHYEQAIDRFQQLLDITRESDNRFEEGRALGDLADTHRDAGQYEQAIAFYQQRLVVARSFNDRPRESDTLGNLGIAYRALDQNRQALEFLSQALAVKREIDDRRGEGAVLANLGGVYLDLGQYSESIDSYLGALAIAREVEDTHNEANVLGGLGNFHRHIGEYQKALDFYNQFLTVAQERNDHQAIGKAFGGLGNIHLELENYSQAIYYHSQWLEIARQLDDLRSETTALGNLGLAYEGSGEYQEAVKALEESLQLARESDDVAAIGRALGNLGNYWGGLGEWDMAIELHEESLAAMRQIRNLSGEAEALSNLGIALFTVGRLTQAERQLDAAINIWESLRSNDLSETQRISLVETQLDSFRVLQRVLIAQNKTEEALEISEKSRARILLAELLLRLETQSVEKLEAISAPSIAQIQQIAEAQNATLVEYSILFGEEIYIWVVKPTGEIYFESIDLENEVIDLLDLVGATRESIGVLRNIVEWGEDSEPVASDSENISNKLQQLHQILIAPIAEFLPENPNESVIFIPHDELFLVPFSALQDEEEAYLIDRHTILTAPSIQLLGNTQSQQPRQHLPPSNLQNPLVVGDPKMPPLSFALGELPIHLDELPGARQEAEDIATLIGTTPLLGNDATKSVVVQRMYDASIIHLATHGILNELQGLDSGVILAADGTGDPNDGLLTATEITQMNLSAEMVVLSACNTGQGEITGDGVVGLSRSLILAGVPSIVVSLWAVPDAPTGELMVEFYRQLERTNNKAQALRQAMRIIREHYPDPIVWAGFTLIGEAE